MRLAVVCRSAPVRLVGLVLVGSALTLAGCSRTPPEPAPATTAGPEPLSTKASTAAPSAPAPTTSPAAVGSAPRPVSSADRCIAKMPEKAAPIPPPAGKACPVDPDPTNMPTGEVSFPDLAPTLKIQAELAKTDHDVQKGLMYRRSMSDNQGMLFKLDSRRDHTFWMHNTCIALDMMFVDDDGLIVGIVEGAAPLTDAVRSVGCPSSFVLEVNGGWSRKNGVKPGQRITIPFSAR